MGENIYESYKGLIFRIYKELIQLSSKIIKYTIFKRAKDLNRHISKKHIQMVKKHIKR